MLIDRPFEMQLGAALVIGRRVGRIERQAKRARDLDAALQTEVRISTFEIEGGRFRPVSDNRLGSKFPVGAGPTSSSRVKPPSSFLRATD